MYVSLLVDIYTQQSTAHQARPSGHCDTSFLAQPPPLHWAGRGSHLDCSSHLQYLVNTSDEALVNLVAVSSDPVKTSVILTVNFLQFLLRS